MSKKVFIILLNWNNWEDTRECLRSLEKLTYPNFEVIVVDNGSIETPPLNPPLPRGRRGGVGLIRNDENLGFAGGNNVGIKYALKHDGALSIPNSRAERGADYVLLLNNDAVVAPDFLTGLVEAGERNSSFGILGSQIYKYATDEVVFAGGEVNLWLTKAKHTNSNNPAGSDPAGLLVGLQDVDYITGAVLLIKREVVEQIGLMREEYFLYYEDVDWCLRARKAGYRCVLVPASKVWHKVSSSTKEGSPSYIYYHTRNGLMLAEFNGNIFRKIAAYILGAWILTKQVLKFFLFPRKRIWSIAITKGVLDFYRGKYGKYAP